MPRLQVFKGAFPFIALALIVSAPYSLHAQEEEGAAPAGEQCAPGYAFNPAKRECVACNQPCRTGRPGVCARGLWNCEGDRPVCKAAVDPGDRMEICNGEDDDCDGRIDEGFDKDGDRYTTCSGDCDDRDRRIHPDAVERCDGLDNNCNGLIDDGFNVGGYCTTGLGACMREGRLVCSESRLEAVCDAAAGAPSKEICDGLDNDCDGEVDEGLGEIACGEGECMRRVPACKGGKENTCEPGEPGDELCDDGLDNDCDGRVDEGFEGLGRTCYEGVGACRTAGKMVCSEDRLSLTCSAVAGEPRAEVCGNGLDDDCDGETDTDTLGLGEPCTNEQKGECARDGVLACDVSKGVLYCTAANVEPVEEICDGLDNDCDGETDEGVRNACGGCGDLPGVIGEVCAVPGGDECAKGTWVCDESHPAQATCALDTKLTEGAECASDGNACTIDICGEGRCTHPHARDGLACDDGDPCSVNDACQDGICLGGSLMACDDGNPCTADSCNPAAGCVHDAIGQGRQNECGGCEALPAEPGSECRLAGKKGPCATGRYACQPDGAMLCVQSTFGRDEVCNGVDDDCDGRVDEELGTVKCGIGACEVEVAACRNGSDAECVPKDPRSETCSNMGVDDDCNGVEDDVAGLGDSCPVAIGSCIVPGEMKCVGDALQTVCVPLDAAYAEDADGNGVPDYCDGRFAGEDALRASEGIRGGGSALFAASRTRAAIIPWLTVFDSAVMGADSADSAMLLVSGATGDEAGFAVLRPKDVAEKDHFSFTDCPASVGERPMLIAAADAIGSVIASSERGYLRYHKFTSQVPSPQADGPGCRLYGERMAIPQEREFDYRGGRAVCEVVGVKALALMGARPLSFAGVVLCRAKEAQAIKRQSEFLGVDVVTARGTEIEHAFAPFVVGAKGLDGAFLVPLGRGQGAPLIVAANARGGPRVGMCVPGDGGLSCSEHEAPDIESKIVFAEGVEAGPEATAVLMLTERGEAFTATANAKQGSIAIAKAGKAVTSTGGAVESAILFPVRGSSVVYMVMGRERSITAALVTKGGSAGLAVKPLDDERLEPRSEVDDISPGGRFSFGMPRVLAAMPFKRFGGTDLFAAYDMRKAGRSVGSMGFIYWNDNEAPSGRITDVDFDGLRGRARLAFTDPTDDRLRYRAWIRAKHGGSLDHWIDGLEGGKLRFSVKGDAAAVGLWPVEIVVEAADPAGAAVRSRAILARDGTVESISEISD